MKRLQEYFFESEIDDLKSKIEQKLKNTNDIRTLKKVNKLFELTANEYEVVKNNIKDYFNNHCGWNKKISENIRQKVKNYGATKLLGKIINNIKDSSSENKHFLTGDKLKNGSNIYDLINDYVKSIVDSDENLKNDFDTESFDKMIKDIAGFTLGGKVATGAFEFLSAIFLQDLNPKNEKGEGKVVCDINTKKYGFEYKATGARIAGNKEESKPLSPQIIDKTFIDLLYEEFKAEETDTEQNRNQISSAIRNKGNLDSDLDNALKEYDVINFINKLSKRDNLFRNGDPKKGGIQLSNVLEPLLAFGISEDKLNSIIIDSLLSQVHNVKCDNSSKKYLINNYPVVKQGKSNNENLRHIFLILGLCNYWYAEKWDYMLLFDTIETGNYYVIEQPNTSDIIKSMDANIKGKAYSNANPAYGKGTTAQNHAPQIKYIKK